MQQAHFSVESNAVLREAIGAMKDYLGHDVIGMCMGLDMIRRGLGKIGQCALRIDDPELTSLLVQLCVLQPSKDGAPLRYDIDSELVGSLAPRVGGDK